MQEIQEILASEDLQNWFSLILVAAKLRDCVLW